MSTRRSSSRPASTFNRRNLVQHSYAPPPAPRSAMPKLTFTQLHSNRILHAQGYGLVPSHPSHALQLLSSLLKTCHHARRITSSHTYSADFGFNFDLVT
eukprot:3120485-Rhodomonas_salina.2